MKTYTQEQLDEQIADALAGPDDEIEKLRAKIVRMDAYVALPECERCPNVGNCDAIRASVFCMRMFLDYIEEG
jgi:hypothetical protein